MSKGSKMSSPAAARIQAAAAKSNGGTVASGTFAARSQAAAAKNATGSKK